jgi:hypothetical protein
MDVVEALMEALVVDTTLLMVLFLVEVDLKLLVVLLDLVVVNLLVLQD